MKTYTLDQFVALETEVWEALVSGDVEADGRLLADEFLGVYSSGFAGRAEHAEQLQAGPVVKCYEFSEARIQVLSEGIVLLSYKAEFIRHKKDGAGAKEAIFVTSIWQSSSGSWQNVFSQDTKAD
ncbi:nuclear transport factor 2 family protein [bacterium]|nr:nuclear transport factor 2 family protein [bacterium]